MSWTAIWDRSGPVLAQDSPPGEMKDATFLVEGRARPVETGIHTIWTGRSGGGAALSVSHAADGAVHLGHRGLRYRSEPGLIAAGDAFRVVYRSGLTTGSGRVELSNLDRDIAITVQAGRGQPLNPDDFLPDPGLPGLAGLAALANHNAPVGDRPGIETGTLVMTHAGPVPVETLHPGAIVLTEAGKPAQVRKVAKRDSLTLGSMSAVRLRAPYFGLSRDVCLSQHTRLRVSGPEVDYVFGREHVLARAGDLVNGVSVLRDLSQPVRVFHTVELDRPGCVQVGRCNLDTADAAPEAPVIDRAGAQTLMTAAADPAGLIG